MRIRVHSTRGNWSPPYYPFIPNYFALNIDLSNSSASDPYRLDRDAVIIIPYVYTYTII